MGRGRRRPKKAPANGGDRAKASLRAFEQGSLPLALKQIDRALAVDSNVVQYQVLRGNILQRMDRLEESATCYKRALAIDGACADAHYNLGNVRRGQGRLEDAARCFEQAIAIQPEHGQAHNNLGNIYRKMKRSEEAIPCFQKAMALKPDWCAPYANLGSMYRTLERHEEAVQYLERALELEPNLAVGVYNDLGAIREKQERREEAVGYYQRAVRLAPSITKLRDNLARIYTWQGRNDELLEAIRGTLAVEPGRASSHSDLLLCMHYDPAYDAETIWKETQRWAALHAAPLASHIRPHTNPVDPERRLRVGYVSADLRRHSVPCYLAPVLARHDRQQVETFVYSGVPKPDAVTEQLMPLVDHWHSSVGLSDEDLAARIRADGIDILVDLGGHTASNRLLVFARKPAPVQVTWLGYPDTTGLTVMDYRLTDEWADPPGATDHLHSEELLRLPGGFSCYQPIGETLEVGPLPALTAGHVTFGSFSNNLLKVPEVAIKAWAAILRTLPETRLLMKAAPFAEEPEKKRMIERFARHGVSSDRLTLLPYLYRISSHLETYGRADIALDTFPYHGTTTTCETLWMGVPVVTLAGQTHASRTGVSLLTQVGLEEFIAETPERYVELAVEKAQDLDRLRQIRASLRERMASSSLMDYPGFTRKLEDAYRRMWRRWCEKQQQEAAGKGVALPEQQQRAPEAVAPADRSDSTQQQAEQLRQRVASLPYWYHRIELPGGVVTPGWAPVSHDAYRVPEDLRGKRVLDAGAWDGYWTFEALKRGACQVVAIDDFSDYLGALKTGDRRAWETFDLCREALGYTPEQCQRHEISVYEATEERLGRFDVVFCFGLLYHLRYPLMALDGLSAICNGEVFIESAILDDYSPYHGGLGKGYPGGHVVAEFYPGAEYGGNQTNWWAPTLHCLGALVQAAGFPEVQAWKLTDEPKDLAHCRGFAHGKKNAKR